MSASGDDRLSHPAGTPSGTSVPTPALSYLPADVERTNLSLAHSALLVSLVPLATYGGLRFVMWSRDWSFTPQRVIGDVDHRDRDARLGEHVRDPVPHLPCTDDRNAVGHAMTPRGDRAACRGRSLRR